MGKEKLKKIKSLPELLGQLNESIWRLTDVIETSNIPELTKTLKEALEWLRTEGLVTKDKTPLIRKVEFK